MLRLVNAGSGLPKSYIVDTIDHFEPGMIASFTGKLSNLDVCGRSRGYNPVGIIDDIRNQQDDSTQGSGRITVWDCKFEADTDMFEPKNYVLGQNLYVSSNGLLCDVSQRSFDPIVSTTKFYPVAIATKIPSALDPTLRFIWTFQQPVNAAVVIHKAINIKNLTGMTCSSCNYLNEYVNESNQEDGSYICYKCRSGF